MSIVIREAVQDDMYVIAQMHSVSLQFVSVCEFYLKVTADCLFCVN